MLTIAVAGNPNTGKSTIFNLLSNGHAKVGNWPGVTVDKKIGEVKHKTFNAKLVDLPGIYALDAWSEDERVARDYLQSGEPDLLINVLDCTNLERNLYLTTIFQEMGVKMLVVLNMIDVAEKNKIIIDLKKFENELGSPVIAVSALRSNSKERIINKIMELQNANGKTANICPNSTDDELLAEWRYKRIENVMAASVKKGISPYVQNDKIDKIIMSKYFGLPIFLLVMYLLFFLTIELGGLFIDYFDMAFGAVFVDGVRYVLESIKMPEIIIAILSDGVGSGIQALSTFLPIIFLLFFFMGLLESSGYMARAAFVMDRIMRVMGLPGKAFIPMLIGFGCSVPAIMATRNLENKRDRILSVFMVPFMSCGARLPVYILFATVFFPENADVMVFALYLTGIVLAIATGLLLKGIVYRGSLAPFIMELPLYHRPSIKAVTLNALFRLKAFIKKVGKLLVPIIAILGLLNSAGLLEIIGKAIVHVFAPMGVSSNNWQAAVALFSGLFAKETIIGAFSSLTSTPMQEAFNNSSAAAFAFLLFVLLYVPCVAAVSAAAREVGFALVILQALYSTILGWCLAVLFYQIAEGNSLPSIVTAAVLLPVTVLGVVLYARKSGRFWS
ncbi:MAG: ferrous iron transport protein B [Fibromonadales bacterium]|nr:ferrous iron transport protein B [Fibromonadales bacterium]